MFTVYFSELVAFFSTIVEDSLNKIFQSFWILDDKKFVYLSKLSWSEHVFFCSEQFPKYSFDYIGMINNAHISFIKTLTGLYNFFG